MRYVEARLEIEKRDETYRFYLTDALKAIAENTAKLTGGTIMKNRYRDTINPPVYADEETGEKQAQDIINRIKNKLKGG